MITDDSFTVIHPFDTTNFTVVHTPELVLAFSYKTLIAYKTVPDWVWVSRENEWGPTTGKHLNWIGVEKDDRLSAEEFEVRFAKEVLLRDRMGQTHLPL